MTKTSQARAAAVGVAEHGNSAILVTVAPDGQLLDRRRIDLTRGLPTHPYHHEGSWAIGRYVNSPWARKMSLPDASRSSSACARRPRTVRAKDLRRWPRRCLNRSRTSRFVRVLRFRRQPKSAYETPARQAWRIRSCLARRWRLRPKRADGPCIGTIANACFAMRPRRSAARISMRSCARWAV